MRKSRRRGGALVIALLSLLVVMLLSAAVLRSLLAARRQARQTAVALQAAWLAEAALDRASAQLASDSNYTGETWQVELPGETDDLPSATAQIQVARNPDEKAQINVSAKLPTVTAHRSQP